MLKPDDPLGKVTIPLDTVRSANYETVQGWYPVIFKGQQHGELLVRMQIVPPAAPVSTAPAPAAAVVTATGDVVDPEHVALQTAQPASAVIEEVRSALEQRGVDVDQPAGTAVVVVVVVVVAVVVTVATAVCCCCFWHSCFGCCCCCFEWLPSPCFSRFSCPLAVHLCAVCLRF